MEQRLSIVAYSDYVCPWCYIGLERIDRLQREFAVDVEWRPFELHPETPRDGATLVGRLGNGSRAAAYARNIITLAEDSAMTLRMPALVANSHLALEAAEFAREHGGFDAYHRALFAAYLEHGQNIGDPDMLCDVARDAGVDDQRCARRSPAGVTPMPSTASRRTRAATRSSARRRSSSTAASG